MGAFPMISEDQRQLRAAASAAQIVM